MIFSCYSVGNDSSFQVQCLTDMVRCEACPKTCVNQAAFRSTISPAADPKNHTFLNLVNQSTLSPDHSLSPCNVKNKNFHGINIL